MHTRRGLWVGLLLLAAPACGGGSGSGTPFVMTSPVADVCSLLTLADAQTLLPGATAGVQQTTDDTADVWTRECDWDAGGVSGMSVTLVVDGALTSQGNTLLNILATTGAGSGTKMPVSGVGDKAIYFNDTGLDQGLTALHAGYDVDVTVYFLTPDVPESSLQPLVVKAMGALAP
jgi:hypothetical protein